MKNMTEFVAFILLPLYIWRPKTILMFFSFVTLGLDHDRYKNSKEIPNLVFYSFLPMHEVWSSTDVQGPLPFGLSIHKFSSEGAGKIEKQVANKLSNQKSIRKSIYTIPMIIATAKI